MKKIKISDVENTIFLKRIAPFQKGNIVYSSVPTLRHVTGLSNQRLYRMMSYNGLELSQTKYGRKKMSESTARRVKYIKRRIREDPEITLKELGDELNCSKQSISQLIHRYGILVDS